MKNKKQTVNTRIRWILQKQCIVNSSSLDFRYTSKELTLLYSYFSKKVVSCLKNVKPVKVV